ncbi:MAG TPA: GNAT family N-acetyltransferase [Methylophilaceae bacterium]|nr:GNAT family N-acetyltransferase [Methylophilaceae bacterium]
MRVIAVTDDSGGVVEPDWLARAEPVHRQLRPQLPADYAGRMREIFASGARLLIAIESEQVLGVALWRLIENTAEGQRLYVDDLVTDEAQRSKGIGKLLLQRLEQQAQDSGCSALTLDSGVQRASAHHFYFREGMHITSFCFKKKL